MHCRTAVPQFTLQLAKRTRADHTPHALLAHTRPMNGHARRVNTTLSTRGATPPLWNEPWHALHGAQGTAQLTLHSSSETTSRDTA